MRETEESRSEYFFSLCVAGWGGGYSFFLLVIFYGFSNGKQLFL